MEIREATTTDVDAVRSIAEESLNSTYTDFLDEETIDEAIEQWYGEGFVDFLEDDHALVLVVERDGEVVGFSQSELVGQRYGTGQLQWLHVAPDQRGDGTGVRLLVRTRERLLEEGADQVVGFVLADNEGGNQFYRDHGFERAGQREVEIGSETFTENVYVESDLGDEGWGAVDELEVDGESVYVSYGEAARGAKAPFYSTYSTADREEVYAWLCGNCDSLDNAMDTMGRIECNVCGNRRKATRWDASYL
ncbi:GNAT family N-acetyltransferase [Halobiforma lacisalsi AJ5]|uniref:GCN5-like N-acetyltransferase n=1 Tax=Natronobacterium lacisalsi AJ5 TaxID=358396 RepID=M0LUS2_NATLA|nr:GNAT family N-acetyltransferase [Halobiforma lacisalsi]APW99710.1 GNAT family N-acetyltransferase [Halobiforma lacisalsi AJ5]EMA36119.1 GCN5-like N-acetyltransferase [Halobiforma lacisalsi AJ5]